MKESLNYCTVCICCLMTACAYGVDVVREQDLLVDDGSLYGKSINDLVRSSKRVVLKNDVRISPKSWQEFLNQYGEVIVYKEMLHIPRAIANIQWDYQVVLADDKCINLCSSKPIAGMGPSFVINGWEIVIGRKSE